MARAEREEQIVAVAVGEFGARGYAGASMVAIAAPRRHLQAADLPVLRLEGRALPGLPAPCRRRPAAPPRGRRTRGRRLGGLAHPPVARDLRGPRAAARRLAAALRHQHARRRRDRGRRPPTTARRTTAIAASGSAALPARPRHAQRARRVGADDLWMGVVGSLVAWWLAHPDETAAGDGRALRRAARRGAGTRPDRARYPLRVVRASGRCSPATRGRLGRAGAPIMPARAGLLDAGRQLGIRRVGDLTRVRPCAAATGTSLERSVRLSSAAGHAGSRRPSPTATSAPTSERTIEWQNASAGDLDDQLVALAALDQQREDRPDGGAARAVPAERREVVQADQPGRGRGHRATRPAGAASPAPRGAAAAPRRSARRRSRYS